MRTYDANLELRALSQTGAVAVAQRKHNGVPVQLIVLREGAPSRSIHEINARVAQIALARSVEMRIEFKGHSLGACALLPPDWTPGRRYPMVVEVYPHVESDRCMYLQVAPYQTLNLQMLAAHGYVVLNLQMPRNLISKPGRPLGGLTELTLAVVEKVVQDGYADPDRLGIFGMSQGHQAALQTIMETRRFRAPVVMNGISDMASHYGTQVLRYTIFPDAVFVGNFVRYESDVSANYIGAPPWENPQAYIDNSPVFHADRIETPVLIMHSDFDWFPLGQSQEIFSALYRLRKEAAYVTYWGEGHAYTSPGNVRDVWRRVFDWYDTHLGASRLETENRSAPSKREPSGPTTH